MRPVVESKVVEQSSGQIKNGKVTSMSIWQSWVLTLECGHKEVRKADRPEPPTQVKCAKCSRGLQFR